MADLAIQPVQDYGSLLSSFPQAQSNIQTQQAQQAVARAQVPLIGAQTQGIQYQNQRVQAQLDLLRQAQEVMTAPVVNDQYPQYPGAPNPRPPSSEHPQAQRSQNDEDPTLADINLDPQHIMEGAQQKFQVKDIWTPQERQKLQAAGLMEMAGMPNATANIKAQHEARITSASNAAQQGADSAYRSSYAISSAPDGLALYADQDGTPRGVLARQRPDEAQVILRMAKNKFPNDPDKANAWADQITRTIADEIGNAVHPFSGRETYVGKDGIVRDKGTDRPILGGNPEGLSPEQYTALLSEAHKTSTRQVHGADSTKETWEWDGASSPTQWVNNQAAIQRAAQMKAAGGNGISLAPQMANLGGLPAAPIGSHVRSAQAATSPQSTQAPPLQGAAPSTNGGPVANPQINQDQLLPQQQQQPNSIFPSVSPQGGPQANALTAGAPTPYQGNQPSAGIQAVQNARQLSPEQEEFVKNGPPLPTATDTGSRKPNAYETPIAQDTGKARGNLLATATKEQGQANITLATMRRLTPIVANPSIKLGPGSEVYAQAQTFAQNWGPRWVSQAMGDPSQYQVLLKYLTSDQLNTILNEFHNEGAQVRLGAYETRAIMNYMSANPNIAKGAIQQMMTWESADAGYKFDKAKTAIAWVNANRDPSQFDYEGTFARPSIEKPTTNARIIVTGPEDLAALHKGDKYIYNGVYHTKNS